MVGELAPFLPHGRRNALGSMLLRNLVTMQVDQEARRVEERGRRLSAPEREASRKLIASIQGSITELMTAPEERGRPVDRPIPASVTVWLEQLGEQEAQKQRAAGKCPTCLAEIVGPPACRSFHGNGAVVVEVVQGLAPTTTEVSE
jgi:hypothetical protein